jgi:AcrR family transcriptional regulator
MPEPRTGTYHHGDLRRACLDIARTILDEDGEDALSLREVARRAGVSANAPYRHFRDKDALLVGVATLGFEELQAAMAAAETAAAPGLEFVALGQAYVRYAQEHPGLFHLMFSHPCGRSAPEISAAAAGVTALLAARVAVIVPDESQRQIFATGTWSLVHGLAVLLINDKLTSDDPDQLVLDTVITVLQSSRAVQAVGK